MAELDTINVSFALLENLDPIFELQKEIQISKWLMKEKISEFIRDVQDKAEKSEIEIVKFAFGGWN